MDDDDDDTTIVLQTERRESFRAKAPASFLKTIIGDCLCGPIAVAENLGGASTQFVQLVSHELIALGAVGDRFDASKQVFGILQPLSGRTDRLITIGYLIEDPSKEGKTTTNAIPLDIWKAAYPNDGTMPRALGRAIDFVKTGRFESALKYYQKEYDRQNLYPHRNRNWNLIGISSHNIGMILVLLGRTTESIAYFKEAVKRKRNAFGHAHPEVAVSLDELAIQLYASGHFGLSLSVFTESKTIRSKLYGVFHPKHCLLLNNIACCNLATGNAAGAFMMMNDARETQRERNRKTSIKDNLDIIHLAILANNYGYLATQQKDYEYAKSAFEEALSMYSSFSGEARNKNQSALLDIRKNINFVNTCTS